MLQSKKVMFLKELTLIKQVHQNNVCFVITGILKMLVKYLNHVFAKKCLDVLVNAYE